MLGRKNKKFADKRSQGLQKELARIDANMRKTAAELTKEADKGKSPEDDTKVENKIEHIMESLTHEMMQLAGVYHRKKDIAVIKKFLDEQHVAIQSSMTRDDEVGKRQSLDDRIVELHKIMAEERHRIKRASHKELLKFLITLSIALLSLAVSVYALVLR